MRGDFSTGCDFCGGGGGFDPNGRFDFGLPDFNSQTSSFHQGSSFNFGPTNYSTQSYSANNYNRAPVYKPDVQSARFASVFPSFDFGESNLPFVDSPVRSNPSLFSSSLFVDVVSILLPPVGLARGIAEAINGTNVTDKAPLTPFEIGLGLATVGKGRATTKVFSAVEREAQLLLKAPRQMMDHHLLPRQFQRFFEERGIDIDSFTVSLGEITHLKGIHGSGLGKYPGRWNKEWTHWIEANPNATSKDIYQQVGRMMDRYHINDLPIHQYGK